MIDFFLRRVRGAGVAALAALFLGYGFAITVLAPFWSRLVAVEGGRELQTRFGYSVAEARTALDAIAARAAGEASAFFALDFLYAVFYAAGLAALIAFGLRRLNLEAWRALLAAPLIAGLADWGEGACLLSALYLHPQAPDALLLAASVLTSVKLIFVVASLALAGLAIPGLVVWALRGRR